MRVNEIPIFDDEPGDVAWRASSCCGAPLAWTVGDHTGEKARRLGCGRSAAEWTVLTAAGPLLRATREHGAADGTCEACDAGKGKLCRVTTRGRCDQ